MIATASSQPDPTLAVAELQLAMLGELAEMAMVVSRAYAAASVMAAEAVQTILADEVWQPETGRARALAGAKDAADAFQKVSRVVRLTLRLAKTTAEWVRDARAGTCAPVAPKKTAGGTPAVQCDSQDCGRPAGCCPDYAESDPTRAETDRERLDVERPDRLPRTPFRETVDGLCADLGATVDWPTLTLVPPDPSTLVPAPETTDEHGAEASPPTAWRAEPPRHVAALSP